MKPSTMAVTVAQAPKPFSRGPQGSLLNGFDGAARMRSGLTRGRPPQSDLDYMQATYPVKCLRCCQSRIGMTTWRGPAAAAPRRRSGPPPVLKHRWTVSPGITAMAEVR